MTIDSIKMNGELVVIHKSANLLDPAAAVKMSALQHKPLYGKELILNNNSVIVNNNNNAVMSSDLRTSAAASVTNHAHADSNDDNNNDYPAGRSESTLSRCPVCRLDDFPNGDVLNDHVRHQHPGYKPTCEYEDCGEVLPSMKSLAVHSAMHAREKCAIRNVNICNFLDSKKPLYHKMTQSFEASPKPYRCAFCREYCTGAQFMMHWKVCNKHFSGDEHSDHRRDDSETEDVKNSFMAGFNLQCASASDSRTSSDCESNRSPKKSASRLMDAMQSVAAVFPKHPMLFPEEEKDEEDNEDPFMVEVRDMKRRGEFPCRLCKKIFRNLRALKGHARFHISNNRAGIRPYECNICEYSTNDKTVITKHIRNHNGEHPFKCQLCCSRFTTKANCERHLRNAHRKTTREDIKNLLLDMNSSKSQQNSQNFKTKLQTLLTGNGRTRREMPTKYIDVGANFYKTAYKNGGAGAAKSPRRSRESRSDPEDSSNSNDSNNNANPMTLAAKDLKKFTLEPLLTPVAKPYTNFQINGLLDMRMSAVPSKQPYYDRAYGDAVMSTGLLPTLPVPVVSDNGLMRGSPGYGANLLPPAEFDSEKPLDLSVDVSTSDADVLDLSKKKNNNNNSVSCESGVEDLSVKSRAVNDTPPESLSPRSYFSKNSLAYPNFPANSMVNGMALSSFFMPNNTLNTFPKSKIDSEEESDAASPMLPFVGPKIHPLVFGPLANTADRYEEMRQNMSAFAADRSKSADTSKESDHEKTPSEMKFEQKYKDVQKSRSSKTSTVKMVMKDGVLVEKQKQRRYRTEKPFSCSYCSGRFTLRSNMDRHVKQQHPGFWQQRQRGGPNRAHRKSKDECEENLMNVSVDSQLGTAETTSDVEMTPLMEKRPVESDMEVDDEDCKSTKRLCVDNAGYEEDDDEEDLVIDEESQDHENDERSDEQSVSTTPEKLVAKSKEENPDLASVRSLLDNVSTQTFSQYFRSDEDPNGKHGDASEEDEEGLVADSSSECNGSGGEEKSISDCGAKTDEKNGEVVKKKKSAYSSAPNRVHCDFCYRSFPWASSLRRHTLTHTGQKPYKCSNCPLLFTTKSNCDRHFLRKHRNQLSEAQTTAIANVTLGGAAETQSSPSSSERSSASRLIPNFSTRNVPERPFKCNHCPSSTFSTHLNLQKHMNEKHNQGEAKGEEMASLLEQQARSNKKEDSANASDNDMMSETSFADERETKSLPLTSYEQNFCGHVASDLPFKCHLCDRSFGERQEALDHMGESHTAEFQHLMYKGALDMNVKLEDTANHEDSGFGNAVHSDENNAEQKGKFPDYSSRKVICAFCLRRFWSAEDLRRHMRTHTGERPFACDICQRRFTLKHSMLRHRKKHSNKSFTSTSGDNSPNTDDEEPTSPYSDGRELIKALPFVAERKEMPSTIASASQPPTEYELDEGGQEPIAAPMFFRDADKGAGSKVCNKMVTEDGVDLIAKLLDIEDKELVDEMLTSKSAADVAKLLGVQK